MKASEHQQKNDLKTESILENETHIIIWNYQI